MTTDKDAENPLLDAVDSLSRPVRTKIIQDGPVGHLLEGQQIATVEQAPLLNQLMEAIGGTIGIGGSASLANERNMLDADALYRFTIINSTIMDWARMAGATITKTDPAATLRAWYIQYSTHPKRFESERFYISQMNGWVTQIEDKLDPPRIRELPDRCPECEADVWFNRTDKLPYLHPLTVEYKPTGPDMIQDAKASCRACGTSWGVRQLAYEIEMVLLRDWEEAIEEDASRDTPTEHVAAG